MGYVTDLEKTKTHPYLRIYMRETAYDEKGFTYLVSKQVKSIDGLQSSFSKANRTAKIRHTKHYTEHTVSKWQ